jgi:uncharacterized protein YecE (DUF72 family)
MKSRIHVGTSGWSYKHWRELYYPRRLPASRWLRFYAQDFAVTEINASFYRLPSEETVLNWMNEVPRGFVFCPKMSRYLSHMKKLHDPEEPLERFFSVFEPMKKMLGPVLIQLPPFFKFNYDLVNDFYVLLKKTYRAYAFVMEVRHESWMKEDSFTLMAKYDIGFVISQSGSGFPYSEMVTSRHIYIRFHGPGALYASSYPDEMLDEFAQKFQTWARQGHEVWAFFNNDIHGYAVQDAKRLIERTKNKEQ